MILPLSNTGPPEPGRELDAWVWANLGHEVEWVDAYYCPWEYSWYIYRGQNPPSKVKSQPFYMGDSGRTIVPFVSTTSAFFQVVEAMIQGEPTCYFVVYAADDGSTVFLHHPDGTFHQHVNYGKSLEEAMAYAVCACVWKVREGEEDG